MSFYTLYFSLIQLHKEGLGLFRIQLSTVLENIL